MARKVGWAAPVATIILGAALLGLEVALGHGTVQKAVEAMVLLAAFCVALVVLQFRSDTARTLAGQTVDERWALIHRNALAASASLSIVVALVAYVVLELRDAENWQLAFMIVALSGLYVVALAWYRWRS